MDHNSQLQRQCFRAAEKSPDGKAEVIICEVDFLSTSSILSWAVKVVEVVNTAYWVASISFHPWLDL